jgi:hypothetical protein
MLMYVFENRAFFLCSLFLHDIKYGNVVERTIARFIYDGIFLVRYGIPRGTRPE